ncbi:MAG TPA: hypothetical protein VJ735_20250 [Actinomycetes bacterium]|nr:hypothetical protein [Actinomycetes bacterium]
MSRAWDDLVMEAGLAWAEVIARAVTKAVRETRSQPGASGEAHVKIDIQRAAVVNVRRVVEESERASS